MGPIKYYHTAIKQQPDPSTNIMKGSGIFLITGDEEMV